MGNTTPIYVMVSTYRASGVENRVMDHANKDDRVWLAKHCFWALRSGVAVKTTPISAEEARKQKES